MKKYLDKALNKAKEKECGETFTMKSLLDKEDLKQIESKINSLGREFKKAIDEQRVPGVRLVGRTQQNENLYQREENNKFKEE